MAAKATKLYVSPDGNDHWSGRLPKPDDSRTDGPFATLTAARDAIRAMKSAGGLSAPVQVLIQGGTYRLAKPLVLGPEDSGEPDCPITYAALGRGRPVVSGGRQITGWQESPDGAWTAELPDVRAGQWQFHQLFVNGHRRSRPRYPESGNLPVTPVSPEKEDLPEHHVSFRFRPGDIRKDWRNLQDVELVNLQYWMESRLRIESIDDEQNIVRFTGPSWRWQSWSMGYYVENVAEQLRRPGQWYLDRPTGVLTYRPMPREKAASAEAVAPVCEQLLRIEGDLAQGRGVRNVTFRGLSFQHAAWSWPREGHSFPQASVAAPSAVVATGAVDCAFEDCEFAHLGGWGVHFSRGCRDNRVSRCRFHDLGAGAVKVGEVSDPRTEAEATRGIRVADNDVRDGARVYLGAAAIWVGRSGYNTISHNEIQGDFQWAVSVGWNWGYWPRTAARGNVVEYNYAHDIGTGALGSHAALYALGVQPETAFRGNLIHDVHGWPGFDKAASGCGIILDNACAGITIEDNLAYRCDGGGFCTNFNVIGNVIQNNIFALGRYAQLNRYGDPAPPGEWLPNPILFRQNIVYWDRGRLFWDTGWPNFGVLWDYNLYWDPRGQVRFMDFDLPAWQAKGIDRHSLVADPMFRDPAAGDFTLPPDSPAWKIGFQPIDLSAIGIRQASGSGTPKRCCRSLGGVGS